MPDSKRSSDSLRARRGDEPDSRRSLGEGAELPLTDLAWQVGVDVALRVDEERLTAPRAPSVSMVRSRRLRRLADWLSALVADDGMSERFAAERQRDEKLVGRVERQRRV
jgi:hypothetical protein